MLLNHEPHSSVARNALSRSSWHYSTAMYLAVDSTVTLACCKRQDSTTMTCRHDIRCLFPVIPPAANFKVTPLYPIQTASCVFVCACHRTPYVYIYDWTDTRVLRAALLPSAVSSRIPMLYKMTYQTQCYECSGNALQNATSTKKYLCTTRFVQGVLHQLLGILCHSSQVQVKLLKAW